MYVLDCLFNRFRGMDQVKVRRNVRFLGNHCSPHELSQFAPKFDTIDTMGNESSLPVCIKVMISNALLHPDAIH